MLPSDLAGFVFFGHFPVTPFKNAKSRTSELWRSKMQLFVYGSLFVATKSAAFVLPCLCEPVKI
jgi:hypothetical protein